MRMRCPHCKSTAYVRNSVQMTVLTRQAVFGMQPVAVVRRMPEACGPSATHMHMQAWGRPA